MGINEWRDEYEWPLRRTKYTRCYFHSDGHAYSRYGDGGLSMTESGSEPPDTYKHNPNNPVPTQGGQTLYRGIQTFRPKNQSWIEERQDILVFTSKQLEEPVEVTGPIKVVLWSTSSVFLPGHKIRVAIASSNYPH